MAWPVRRRLDGCAPGFGAIRDAPMVRTFAPVTHLPAPQQARKKALQHVLQGLQTLVGAAGFELATLCSQSRCATRLRYAPTARILTRQIPRVEFNACFFDYF